MINAPFWLIHPLMCENVIVRGGILENFYIRNIKVGECSEAIFRVEMKYEGVFEGPNLPLVKNFLMENVIINGKVIEGFKN